MFVNDLMAIAGKTPVVVESHLAFGRKVLKRGLTERLLLLWQNPISALRQCSLLIALTEGDAKEWRRINDDVRVIPNVVHLNEGKRYSDVLSKRVIFSSRFAVQKGIPYLIEIWKQLHILYPDWILDIYADGELLNVYKPQMEKMDMNVAFHAPSCEIFQHYCESSIFMLTSVFEPFGLVLPEAMSCGLPVVTFDCDFGPREIIDDGKNGFLIPPFNVDAYVSRMSQLMDSLELRQRMGQAGISSSKRFSPEMIMPYWKHLFEELVS
jgi:glycosyltransferase involved in cell wall biosynthesis